MKKCIDVAAAISAGYVGLSYVILIGFGLSYGDNNSVNLAIARYFAISLPLWPVTIVVALLMMKFREFRWAIAAVAGFSALMGLVWAYVLLLQYSGWA